MTDRIAAARAAIGDSYVTGDTCEVDCHTLRLLCDLADTWSTMNDYLAKYDRSRAGTTYIQGWVGEWARLDHLYRDAVKALRECDA